MSVRPGTAVRARGAAVIVGVRHSCVLAHSMGFERALFGRDPIHVHRTVTALCGDVFVEGVPCYALDIVIVLSDLTDAFA
jgi:hypothetical protein